LPRPGPVGARQAQRNAADAGAPTRPARGARAGRRHPPQGADLIADWWEPRLAQRLKARGIETLADLRRLVDRGGRWYRILPGMGALKARRLAEALDVPIPPTPIPLRAPPGAALTAVAAGDSDPLGIVPPVQSAPPAARLESGPLRDTTHADRQIVDAWIESRAASTATARSYRRKARRWQMWLALERCKGLQAVAVDDVLAYRVFLAGVAGVPGPGTGMPRRARRAKHGGLRNPARPGRAPRRDGCQVPARELRRDGRLTGR
jgi:hypothetical protein